MKITKEQLKAAYTSTCLYHNSKQKDLELIFSDDEFDDLFGFIFEIFKNNLDNFEVYNVSYNGLYYFSVFYLANGLKIHFDDFEANDYPSVESRFQTLDSFLKYINNKIEFINERLKTNKKVVYF
jgi:hypothetical protein